MRYYRGLLWNDKNIEHIARHHITPGEVEEVVYSQERHTRKGMGQGIYYIFGQAGSGRYLFIVLLDIGRHIGRVITARDMTEREKKWHRH